MRRIFCLNLMKNSRWLFGFLPPDIKTQFFLLFSSRARLPQLLESEPRKMAKEYQLRRQVSAG